jgi:tRNA(Ile)-lysidine synthase
LIACKPRSGAEKIQPEAIANMARSAALLGDAQSLLNRLAQQDGKSILTDAGLKVKPLLALADVDLPAANNLLRYWLQTQEMAMPSQERLQAWWRDMFQAKNDAKLEWLHNGQKICLWRGTLQVAKIDEKEQGEWVFKSLPRSSKKPGLSASWVQEAQQAGLIACKPRSGAEKIQIKPNSPRRTLKNLFQEADIPPWQRNAPLLYVGQDLIAVAGVGISYPHLSTSGMRVLPEWVQNPVK